jgi:hypothetical protein
MPGDPSRVRAVSDQIVSPTIPNIPKYPAVVRLPQRTLEQAEHRKKGDEPQHL